MAIAVVLVRGKVGLRHDVLKTLDLLGLDRKHACSIVKDTREMRGMLIKVKDFTTYGEISDAAVEKLAKARKAVGNQTFRMHPPRGGWERKGTKVSWNRGGALGPRDNMEALLERMA